MLRATLLAFALLAVPARADPPEQEPTAAPGSIAYGLIEAANAEGVFDIVHNGQVSVHHLASGLRCDFEREGGRITLFLDLPRGDNVACDEQNADRFTTTSATRYPEHRSLESTLAEAVAAIRQRYPDATAITPTTELYTQGLPEQRAAYFLTTLDGARYFSSIHVVQVGEWSIKQHFTEPAAADYDPGFSALLANMMFTQTLNQIISAQTP